MSEIANISEGSLIFGDLIIELPTTGSWKRSPGGKLLHNGNWSYFPQDGGFLIYFHSSWRKKIVVSRLEYGVQVQQFVMIGGLELDSEVLLEEDSLFRQIMVKADVSSKR